MNVNLTGISQTEEKVVGAIVSVINEDNLSDIAKVLKEMLLKK